LQGGLNGSNLAEAPRASGVGRTTRSKLERANTPRPAVHSYPSSQWRSRRQGNRSDGHISSLSGQPWPGPPRSPPTPGPGAWRRMHWSRCLGATTPVLPHVMADTCEQGRGGAGRVIGPAHGGGHLGHRVLRPARVGATPLAGRRVEGQVGLADPAGC
jgi:hypothetical protein